jgi:small-conductance mechanosensitive channel
LIGEIDKTIRNRKATRLLQWDNPPINPVLWPNALSAISKYVQDISAEAIKQWTSKASFQQRKQNWISLIFLVISGFALIFPVLRWVNGRLETAKDETLNNMGNIARLLLSVAVFIVPYAGLLLLLTALIKLDIFSVRGDLMITSVPWIGLAVFGANWLARNVPQARIYSKHAAAIDGAMVVESQRIIRAIGIVVGFAFLLGGLAKGADWPKDVLNVLRFPLVVLLGLGLFRIGQKFSNFKTILKLDDDPTSILERVVSVFVWACYLSGVGGPLLAAIGYVNAGAFLVYSMVMTLALSAAIVILYILLVRFLSPGQTKNVSEITERPQGNLRKVALAFVLICASIPVYALIWGARISDLTNLWSTLNKGVSLGGTRISTSDFLVFILVFFIGYTITRLLQSTLRTVVFPNTRIESGAQNALVTGFGYVGIFLAALVAITTTGLDLSSLAIVAGALSVGIGFGLQAIVSNFVSGIILLIERPVKIGDWVQVGTYSGTIKKVSVRSTTIETFDGASVIIPNADLISGAVTNWTHGNVRGRVKVPVGVAYGTDPDLVKEVLLSIANDHHMVLKLPKPQVVFMGFGADAMDFQLRGILRDVNYVLSTASDINFEIVKRFRANGIEIPFAQREVTIKNAKDFLPKAARKPRTKPKT